MSNQSQSLNVYEIQIKSNIFYKKITWNWIDLQILFEIIKKLGKLLTIC